MPGSDEEEEAFLLSFQDSDFRPVSDASEFQCADAESIGLSAHSVGFPLACNLSIDR
jgi:hypothetical protein